LFDVGKQGNRIYVNVGERIGHVGIISNELEDNLVQLAFLETKRLGQLCVHHAMLHNKWDWSIHGGDTQTIRVFFSINPFQLNCSIIPGLREVRMVGKPNNWVVFESSNHIRDGKF